MVVASANAGPRYAPADPTLPPPWRALVDGNTGYIYYWNTETNVTQYEKPTPPPPQAPPQAPPLPSGPPPLSSGPKLAPLPQGSSVLSSSTQAKTLQLDGLRNQQHANNVNRNFSGSKVGMVTQPKLAAIPVPRGQQSAQGFSATPQPTSGSLNGPSYGPVAQGAGPQGNFKRNADNYEYNNRDEYKRQRTQDYYEPPTMLDVEAYMKQHEVTVLGDNVPAPFITFDAAGFPPLILQELQAAGFTSPTPVQAQSWPVAMQNRDIVAIAKTGSGKTLGYLLPAFLHLEPLRNNARVGPTVLVLAPTRELATQIQSEAVKFGRSSRITSTCVYGGAPKGPQLRDIERGADIIIATPGRLNDFLEMKKVSLRQVSYLVLDEADRMLDMGFEPQIRKIVAEIQGRKQTLMYTATWPKEVRRIAADLLLNPVQVNIGNTDELSANKSITQYVEVLLPHEKQRRLEQILRMQDPGSKIIIFCSTKKMCDQLARALGRDFSSAAIHGDKSQTDRDWVLSQFKSGKAPILVATDVAARGLDIKDIRIVINYDFPTGIEDYVHRIGRTGRAGATGVAYTFFSQQDAKYAVELIKVLEGASQKVPPQLRDFASRGSFMRARGRWDSGGRGRDAGRGEINGGRGETFAGRGDAFSGRGQWGRVSGAGRLGTRDGPRDRLDGDRFGGRDDFRPKFFDGRGRGGEAGRRIVERPRGRSFSRSYSRSSSRSRGRSYSRSRSCSGDRYPVEHYRGHSRSPLRSPYMSTYRSKSPYRRRSPYHSSSPLQGRSSYQSASPRDESPYPANAVSGSSPPPKRAAFHGGAHRSSPRRKSPYRSGAPRSSPSYHRSPYRGGTASRSSPPHVRSPRETLMSSHSSPLLDRSLYHAAAASSHSPLHDRPPYRASGPSCRSSPDRSPYRSRAPSACSPSLYNIRPPSARSPSPYRNDVRLACSPSLRYPGASSARSLSPSGPTYRAKVRSSPPGRLSYRGVPPTQRSPPHDRSPYHAGLSSHGLPPVERSPDHTVGIFHSSPLPDGSAFPTGEPANLTSSHNSAPYHVSAPSRSTLEHDKSFSAGPAEPYTASRPDADVLPQPADCPSCSAPLHDRSPCGPGACSPEYPISPCNLQNDVQAPL